MEKSFVLRMMQGPDEDTGEYYLFDSAPGHPDKTGPWDPDTLENKFHIQSNGPERRVLCIFEPIVQATWVLPAYPFLRRGSLPAGVRRLWCFQGGREGWPTVILAGDEEADVLGIDSRLPSSGMVIEDDEPFESVRTIVQDLLRSNASIAINHFDLLSLPGTGFPSVPLSNEALVAFIRDHTESLVLPDGSILGFREPTAASMTSQAGTISSLVAISWDNAFVENISVPDIANATVLDLVNRVYGMKRRAAVENGTFNAPRLDSLVFAPKLTRAGIEAAVKLSARNPRELDIYFARLFADGDNYAVYDKKLVDAVRSDAINLLTPLVQQRAKQYYDIAVRYNEMGVVTPGDSPFTAEQIHKRRMMRKEIYLMDDTPKLADLGIRDGGVLISSVHLSNRPQESVSPIDIALDILLGWGGGKALDMPTAGK